MQPVVTTLLFDLIGVVLVVILFKYLRSDATAEGSARGLGKWKAGGALAGFLILVAAQIYMIGYFTPKGEEALPSYHTIMDFYDDLEQGKDDKAYYDKAWNLMSRDLQRDPRRWGGNKELFEKGFRNTKQIRLRAVKLVSSSSSQYSHDYVAYYQDETDAPVLSGLTDLDKQTVRDIPALMSNIQALRNRLLEKGADVSALDNMMLGELLSANRGDILRFRIEKVQGEKKTDGLFPDFKVVRRLIGRKIVVGLHHKKWLIDKIDPIQQNIEHIEDE